MNKEKVTMGFMADNYDIEEMTLFIDDFMNFVNGVKNNPN